MAFEATFTLGTFHELAEDKEAMMVFMKWYKILEEYYHNPIHAFDSLCEADGYFSTVRTPYGAEYIQTPTSKELVCLPFDPSTDKAFFAGQFVRLQEDAGCMSAFNDWFKATKNIYGWRHPKHAFNSLCKNHGHFSIHMRKTYGKVYIIAGTNNWERS